eukprot:gene5368-5603_t
MSFKGTASACRTKGNELYAQADYAGAAAAYSEGLQQLQQLRSAGNAERSTLLSNRAACHLAVGNAAAAEADCKAGIAQAASPKLYYRLAKALMGQSRQDVDLAGASAAMAVAVALLQLPAGRCVVSEEMMQLYAKIAVLTHAAGFKGPELPHSPNGIQHAACTQTLCQALSRGAEFVVLSPGSYNAPAQLSNGGRVTLIGIGTVELLNQFSHAVFVQQGTVTLVNMQLAGSGHHAAACVSTPRRKFPMFGAASSSQAPPSLLMIDCRVVNYSEGGLLVCGGQADLIRCYFQNCRLHAMEVRQGGSLTADFTVVDHCQQGVIAYGGARRVRLTECSITNTSKEGVLAAGTYENAATVAQHGMKGRRVSEFRDDRARLATEEAEAWGQKRGIHLDVEFVFGGKSAKSVWAKSTGATLKLSGIQVGVNYGGTVRVVDCAFAGPRAQAILSELEAPAGFKHARLMGLWTKAPFLQHNDFCASSDQLPSLGQLSARLGLHLPAESAASRAADQQRKARTPTAPELCRPAGTFAQQGWSVTNMQYYAIGNTLGSDVTSGLLPGWQFAADGAGDDRAAMPMANSSRVCSTYPSSRPVRVLLAGCGDLRNLFATVAAVMPAPGSHPSGGSSSISSDGAIAQPSQMQFVLNDGNLAMLARDAAMLHMVVELAAPPEVVLAVWANHALSEEQHELLLKSCTALAEMPWPAWLSAGSWLDGSFVQQQHQQQQQGKERTEPLQGVHRPTSTANSMEAAAEGAHSLGVNVDSAEQSIRDICAAWAGTSMSLAQLMELRDQYSSADAFQSAVELSLAAVESSVIERSLSTATTAEIRSYIRRGRDILVLATTANAVGPSMTADAQKGDDQAEGAQPDITRSSLDTSAARDLNTALAVRSAALYDYIDTSNVSDYTSLPALLQACSLLLKPEPHARLRLESIVAHQRSNSHSSNSSRVISPDQYVERCLGGIDPGKYMSLLGLKFLGGTVLPGNGKALHLQWAPADAVLCRSGGSGSCQSTNSIDCQGAAATAAAASAGRATTRAMQTAVGLFLDLKPAWKHFVEAYLVDPSSQSGSAGRGGAAQGGRAHGSPLTLLHLLAEVLPPAASEAMVHALISTAAKRGLAAQLGQFDWELTLHTGINAGKMQECISITYPANPGFNLVGYNEAPLLLALSPAPLTTGPVSLDAIKQLFSTFAWDEDMATATLLLPPEVQHSCPRWAAYITLCVASSHSLQAVGESQRLAPLLAPSKASTHTGRVAVQPWLKPLQSSKQLQFEQPGKLLQDCTLLEQVVRSDRCSWQSVCHMEPASAQLIVDILAPSAIHKDAVVQVVVGQGQLTVSLTAGKEKKGVGKAKHLGGQGSTGLCQASYLVQLPPGADGESGQPAAVKLSRALGLMSVRVR